MSLPRLNRLFAEDGRCLILAFDHGLFGEPSWLRGVEDLDLVLETHAAEGPDAMLLPTGSARKLQARTARPRPGLILRADVTSGYLADRPERMVAYGLAQAVERAVRLDAVAVVAALLTFPGQDHLHFDCLRTIDALRAACDPVGMALEVEVLAMTENDGVPKVSEDVAVIAPLVRQAFDAGADLVKADPPSPAEDFAGLLDAAGGLPVVSSGGIPGPDEVILERSAAVVRAGASGLAYGRNVLWAREPRLMTRALKGIVHEGLTAAEAIRIASGASDDA